MRHSAVNAGVIQYSYDLSEDDDPLVLHLFICHHYSIVLLRFLRFSQLRCVGWWIFLFWPVRGFKVVDFRRREIFIPPYPKNNNRSVSINVAIIITKKIFLLIDQSVMWEEKRNLYRLPRSTSNTDQCSIYD